MSDTVEVDKAEDTTDWKAEARKWEGRAKQNKAELDTLTAERDALKEKADRFDQIEEDAKSELQKAQERAEAAEAALQERTAADQKAKEESDRKAELAALAVEVATATGVPADALRGNSRDELEAHATTLKSLIKEPLVIEGQERTPDKEPSEERAFVRGLFGGD